MKTSKNIANVGKVPYTQGYATKPRAPRTIVSNPPNKASCPGRMKDFQAGILPADKVIESANGKYVTRKRTPHVDQGS